MLLRHRRPPVSKVVYRRLLASLYGARAECQRQLCGSFQVDSHEAPRSGLGRELPIGMTTAMSDRVALHQGTFGHL